MIGLRGVSSLMTAHHPFYASENSDHFVISRRLRPAALYLPQRLGLSLRWHHLARLGNGKD